jgi:hypothetical protein
MVCSDLPSGLRGPHQQIDGCYSSYGSHSAMEIERSELFVSTGTDGLAHLFPTESRVVIEPTGCNGCWRHKRSSDQSMGFPPFVICHRDARVGRRSRKAACSLNKTLYEDRRGRQVYRWSNRGTQVVHKDLRVDVVKGEMRVDVAKGTRVVHKDLQIDSTNAIWTLSLFNVGADMRNGCCIALRSRHPRDSWFENSKLAIPRRLWPYKVATPYAPCFVNSSRCVMSRTRDYCRCRTRNKEGRKEATSAPVTTVQNVNKPIKRNMCS